MAVVAPPVPPLSSPPPSPQWNASPPAHSGGADLISCLPNDILGSILALLPIKESARTSILSSQWRSLWTLAPLCIEVDDDLKNLGAIADIISRHRGPIRGICLSRDLWKRLLDSPHLDQTLQDWAQTLAERGIQHLGLHYKIPERLLTCNSLRTLNLTASENFKQILALPPNLNELNLGPFDADAVVDGDIVYQSEHLPPAIVCCQSLRYLGLRWYDLKVLQMPLAPNLKMLRLTETLLPAKFLTEVLSTCRNLDTVWLERSWFLDDVHLSSPHLRRFIAVDSAMAEAGMYFGIEDAPRLEVFMFNAAGELNLKVANAPKLQFLGFAYDLFSTLDLGETRLQNGTLTRSSTTLLDSVNTLAVELDLTETYWVKVVADLLKFFPRLEVLDVVMCYRGSSALGEHWMDEASSGGIYLEQQTSSDCLNRHLKMVSLKGNTQKPKQLAPAILALARYLVHNACLLKLMSICCNISDKSCEEMMERELLLENRASPELIIEIDTNYLESSTFSTWKLFFD